MSASRLRRTGRPAALLPPPAGKRERPAPRPALLPAWRPAWLARQGFEPGAEPAFAPVSRQASAPGSAVRRTRAKQWRQRRRAQSGRASEFSNRGAGPAEGRRPQPGGLLARKRQLLI